MRDPFPSPRSVAAHQIALLAWMREQASVLVAFSGGVDSAVVLKAAALALGSRAVAMTADSPALPRRELEEAVALARFIGVQHHVVASGELEDPRYSSNPIDRCFYCKSELYHLTKRLARDGGIAVVVNGANRDDLGDFRPGMEAARQAGIRSPLIELGLRKQEIRELAHAWKLPVWDKPATPCLSSRFAPLTPIDRAALSQVERAEEALHGLGLRIFRVRRHEALARLELGPEEQARFYADPRLREAAVQALAQVGFRFITLDLRGFRSGGFNPPSNP